MLFAGLYRLSWEFVLFSCVRMARDPPMVEYYSMQVRIFCTDSLFLRLTDILACFLLQILLPDTFATVKKDASFPTQTDPSIAAWVLLNYPTLLVTVPRPKQWS